MLKGGGGGGGRGVPEGNVDLNYRNLRDISDLNCRPYTQFLNTKASNNEKRRRQEGAYCCFM